MKTYDAIARAVFSRPWAVLPETLQVIVAIMRGRLAGERLEHEEIEARVDAAAVNAGPRSGAQRSGAVAVLPLYGVIVPRAGMMSEMSGGTSVERFRSNFRDALGDDRVSAILIDCDSPGGSVDQVPEMADEVRAARGQKPVVAIANTLQASAAYWICSAASELWASPSALVGSIGVIAAHQDLSKAAEIEGVKTTLISAGKFKTEGNQYEPLTEEARAAIQDEVDQFYAMFTGAVAKSRGVPVATVRDTYGQGRVLSARDAKTAGMVDQVGTFDQALIQAARLGLGDGTGKPSAVRGAGATRLIAAEDVLHGNGGLAAIDEEIPAADSPANEGGEAPPADDPDATASEEAGTPPVDEAADTEDDGAAELELERAKADADADRVA